MINDTPLPESNEKSDKFVTRKILGAYNTSTAVRNCSFLGLHYCGAAAVAIPETFTLVIFAR